MLDQSTQRLEQICHGTKGGIKQLLALARNEYLIGLNPTTQKTGPTRTNDSDVHRRFWKPAMRAFQPLVPSPLATRVAAGDLPRDRRTQHRTRAVELRSFRTPSRALAGSALAHVSEPRSIGSANGTSPPSPWKKPVNSNNRSTDSTGSCGPRLRTTRSP